MRALASLLTSTKLPIEPLITRLVANLLCAITTPHFNCPVNMVHLPYWRPLITTLVTMRGTKCSINPAVTWPGFAFVQTFVEAAFSGVGSFGPFGALPKGVLFGDGAAGDFHTSRVDVGADFSRQVALGHVAAVEAIEPEVATIAPGVSAGDEEEDAEDRWEVHGGLPGKGMKYVQSKVFGSGVLNWYLTEG